MKSSIAAIAVAASLILAVPAGAQGLAGPYLAANQADLRNDYAAAADYYGQALLKRPSNAALVNNAMVVNIVAGRLTRAQVLAEQLQELVPDNQLMALTRLAEALRTEDYALAQQFATDEDYRLNPLLATLSSGWSMVGEGAFTEGAAVFTEMGGNDAMEAYGQMNAALALAFAGDFASAAEILDGDEDGPLHLNRLAMLTHYVSLSQAERMEEATTAVAEALRGTGGSDRELAAMLETLESGEPLEFSQILAPKDGAAHAYAVLAGALIREERNQRLGLLYARLSLHINPDNDELLSLVGDVFATQGQFDLAISAYEEIPPSSPWYVTSEIGRAEALSDADRADEAALVLSNLARGYPDLVSVHTALGDLLRQEEEFERASTAYSKAVELVINPAAPDWRLFYVRAITFERTDRWPEAEADFRKALELNPEQPHVLNYLGYSLVELRRNLEEAEDMIRRAVAQRPEDGFITDSLGWVLYRLGRYDEAVEPMERAAMCSGRLAASLRQSSSGAARSPTIRKRKRQTASAASWTWALMRSMRRRTSTTRRPRPPHKGSDAGSRLAAGPGQAEPLSACHGLSS